MKNKHIFAGLTVASVLILASGCGKEAATPPTASEPVKPASTLAVDDQKAAAETAAKEAEAKRAEAEKAAQALKAQAEKEAQALKDQAEAANSAAAKAAADKQAQLAASVSKVQGLIDTAKKLSGENKWAEALKIVNDLAGQKLTPDQQTIVAGLKQQAQKQAEDAVAKKAASEAEKAIGGLLKPKTK